MGRVNSELVDVPEEGRRARWLCGLEGERDRGVRVICVDSIKMQRKKIDCSQLTSSLETLI